ncbi:MAG TPA: hypothetical protein VMM27_00485 [Casimicrobiaceae bacterium]|nr:hypothetical protein [Casimicrobiaceae bacterium]
MADDDIGLYPAGSFRPATGETAGGGVPREAQWYFARETILVPKAPATASFAPGQSTFDDLRQWSAARGEDAPADAPPLVWIGSTHTLRGASMSEDGRQLRDGGAPMPVRTVAKIPLNRSYYDASSVAFLALRPLSVRGEVEDGAFVMRTVWPEDFRFGPGPPSSRDLPAASTPALALRALMREAPRGGAQSAYAAWTLWRRDVPERSFGGRPVLAFMVNGAQGDDDEAHAGHFALVTGRVRADGSIGDWLVDNFYSLDIESEKGILAAPVPLDNYLGDLNSGQSWYRPSYVLVLVLRDARAPSLVQSAINRVYRQFYRHQLPYYHPDVNCTSISIDTLRTLGWPVRARGASASVLAWLAFPFMALRARSIAKAKVSFDYLMADQTRLLPAAALEEVFTSVLALARGDAEAGALARMVAEDLEAIAFLRVPQFPSSRAFGDAPAVSTAEYRSRVPKDPAQVQIVPVPPRPLPAALRDPDVTPPPRHPSDDAALSWGAIAVVGVALLARRLMRRR